MPTAQNGGVPHQLREVGAWEGGQMFRDERYRSPVNHVTFVHTKLFNEGWKASINRAKAKAEPLVADTAAVIAFECI